ncbi:MAG: protein kinase [Chloroflexota bacterium]
MSTIKQNFLLLGNNKPYVIEFEQEVLGKGAQGSVYRVAQINGKPYGTWAIKILIDPPPGIRANFEDRLKALVEFMSNVLLNNDAEGLSCVPAALLQSQSEKRLAILMRYAPDYDLDNGGKLPALNALPQRLAIGHQLAKCVRRLHEKGVVIGDLANDNIIVDHLNWALYLVDLDGISFALNGKNYPLLADNSGKGSHCSPEFNSKNPYTIEMDLWGLSTLLHFILTDWYPMENNLFGLARTYADSVNIIWPPANHPKSKSHLRKLRVFGEPIREAMITSFNDGRVTPSKRLSAIQWETLFAEAQRHMYLCNCAKDKPFVAIGIGGKVMTECPRCKLPLAPR